MSKFKPGDKVICVDPIDGLAQNALYEVYDYNPLTDLLSVKEHGWSFMGYRFKLAQHLDPIVTSRSAFFAEADGLPQGNELSRDKKDLLDTNVTAIVNECQNAMFNWPEFNSAHEGFAVLAEEVDELWEYVKTNQKKRDIAKMKTECIQIAAMALRFATEICDTKKANN